MILPLRRPIALLFLGVAAAGCQKSPPPAAVESSVASGERARRLALLTPPGGQPVDLLLRTLQDRARQDPQKVDWWIALGQSWVRKARESTDSGYYANARACAEVALAIQPTSHLALDLQALVLLNEHRFAEARDLARRTLALRGDDVMAWGSLADALYELGQLDQAEAAVQKMMELKPGLPAYSRASYLQWVRGQSKAAKESIRLAVDSAGAAARDPEPRAWALVQAAMLFWHEGDYEGADVGFAMAEQALPDYPPALVGRGRCALARGDGQRAAELLERAFRGSPLVETAWLLGDARSLAGDAPGAAAAYATVDKSGRRGDPRTLSLFLSTTRRDPDEALRLAEAEKRERGDLYTDDALAFALYRKGRFAEARALIDPLLALGTRDARLLFHGGAIHRAGGDVPGGDKLLREALALNPKFDLAAAAEARSLLSGK